MAQHAKFSPSGADKWMTCAGAIAMEEGIPDSSSEYADEGTAAHFLASESLSNNTHPATYIGRVIEVGRNTIHDFDGAIWQASPEYEGWVLRSSYTVDADMVAHVNTYVQDVRKSVGTGELLVEQRLDISCLTGEEGAEGTGDAIILKPDEKLLEVHDLKYGQGTIVSPVSNRQLMTYGLAALMQYEMLGDFDEVLLVIHQPRVSHKPLEWRISATDLRTFGEVVKAKAKDAMIAFEHRANWLPKGLSESVAYLEPSEDGCMWCRAKATCPALAQQVMSTVADDFVDLSQDIAPQLEGVSDRTMDGANLANCLKAVPLVEMWCKAVRAKSYAELSGGADVPGFKLVEGKMGNRQWSDEAEAEAMLKMMKCKVDEMYDLKLISPTSAEKIFGEKGSAPSVKRWNKLNALITRKPGANSVAPADDPRPAIVINRAAEFVDESGEDLG